MIHNTTTSTNNTTTNTKTTKTKTATTTTTSPSHPHPHPPRQRLIRNQFLLLLLLCLMVILNIILLLKQNFVSFPSSSSSSSMSSSSMSSSLFDLRNLRFQQQSNQPPQSLEDKKKKKPINNVDVDVDVDGGDGPKERTISSSRSSSSSNYSNINDDDKEVGQEEERRYNSNNNNNNNNKNHKCLHVETKTKTDDTNDDDDHDDTNIYTNHYESSSSLSSLSSSSLEDYIIKSNRIAITMPAKAAGSSLKQFTYRCNNNFFVKDNFINSDEATEDFLLSSFRLPKIIASHVLKDTTLIDLIQHSSPSTTLLIHIYRDETSRLVSGIKHVVNREICRWTQSKAGYSPHNIALPDESYCMIDEIQLVKLIKTRMYEIGFGNVETLTCDLYQTIDNNMPRDIIFVHYTKVNQLQKLLSKHYCPELLESEQQQQQQQQQGEENNNGGIVESNTSKGKPLDRIYVQLKKSSTTTTTTTKEPQTKQRVTLTEWLNEKSDFLEWTLKLRKGGISSNSNSNSTSCQGRTNSIEESLILCKNHIIKL